MKRVIDRPHDPKPSGIIRRRSQRPLPLKERFDLFLYHDLISPTLILHISLSSSVFHSLPPFFIPLFYSKITTPNGRNLEKNSCGSYRHVRNSILERIAPSNFYGIPRSIACRHEKVRLQRLHFRREAHDGEKAREKGDRRW